MSIRTVSRRTHEHSQRRDEEDLMSNTIALTKFMTTMMLWIQKLVLLLAALAPWAQGFSASLTSSLNKLDVANEFQTKSRMGANAIGVCPAARLQMTLSPTASTLVRGGSFSLRGSPIGWILTSAVGGASGVPVVGPAIKTWYRKINLPSWTPPDQIFAPVWTVLYSLMGYSGYLVYKQVGSTLQHPAMRLALVHYLVNICWAPMFFGLKRLRLAHVMNIALVLTLVGIMIQFYPLSQLAVYLLIPYLLWLVFATALSGSICQLNPTTGGYNNAMMEDDIYKLQQQAAKQAGL